ncbi:hypothetical protein [Actinoplanes subglobosus]|uniref:Uncharacterized protein n=1 Tax=Actinoplanes subglobosus TaxID=1547892 RepID=A0ABV8J8W9_9ACTN
MDLTDDPAILDELSALADGLAGYLSQADQADRLLLLFADDRRLARRYDPRTGGWDDYHEDLEAAWDVLDRRLATSEGLADPVPSLIRLALVRATLSSAEDVPPALVAAAVGTGAWSVDRTLSTIGRHPSPDHRVLMLGHLLRTLDLDEDTTRAVTAQMIELSRLPGEDLPAEALLRNLDVLDPAHRITVTDRIASDAEVVTFSLNDDPRTGTAVSPLAVVEAIERIPEARRPVLLGKVADALLRSLAPSREPDAETTPSGVTADAWRPLMEVQQDDAFDVLLDPTRRRAEDTVLLGRLAVHLHAHPDPDRLLGEVAAVLTAVTDAALREQLAAAFRAAFPGFGPLPEPADGVDGDDDAGIRYRRQLMRQMQRFMSGREEARPGSFLDPSLDEMQSRWLATVLPSLTSQEERVPEIRPGSDESRQLVFDELQRVGSPVFYAIMGVQSGLPDDMVIQMVRSAADPRDLGGQLFIASTVTDSAEDEVRRRAIGLAKAGLLIAAIDHQFRGGPITAAWRGAEAEFLIDVDWEPVLSFVLELPAEKQRNALHRIYDGGDRPETAEIPRLAALRLLMPHLTEERIAMAFRNVMDLPDKAVRRLGLELLAPRLDAGQAETATRAVGSETGRREQAWAMEELVRRLDPEQPGLPDVRRWILTVVTAIRSGTDLAFSATGFDTPTVPGARHHHPAASSLPVDELLPAIREMDVNNQADALYTIALVTRGDLPAALVEEVLRLPGVNASGRESPRSHLISALGSRFPDQCMAAVFDAVMELPHRIPIGDAQAWGWNWTYEYPRGSALLALAERLPDDLAEAALPAIRELPWMAREEVLQRMAPRVGERLAAVLFDYSFEIHEEYRRLPEPTRIPWVLEMTVATTPLEVFLIERQVHLAEMLSALAPRLDADRLARAVQQALDFDNEGPRAWLPARLLPLLDEHHREPLLSSGAIAAMEFTATDPSRLDLLSDLLPYMQTEIARRRAELDAYQESLLPGRRGLLDREELDGLAVPEATEYLRLLGADVLAELQAMPSDGDEDARRLLMQRMLLSPLYAEHIQGLLTRILISAPLPARAAALENMRQILEPDAHAEVVAATLRQAREATIEAAERIQCITALLPYLDQAQHDDLLTDVARLPGPKAEDDSTTRADFIAAVLTDFGKPLAEDPRFPENRPSVAARAVIEDMTRTRSEVLFRIRGPRVLLLDHLAPRLSPDGRARAVELVSSLPELERADGLTVLLQVSEEPDREPLRAALAALTSPFARFWALFTAQDAWKNSGTEPLTALARRTAEDFQEPDQIAVFLLMLAGYAADDQDGWVRHAIDLAGQLSERPRLRLLALAARFALRNPELGRALLDEICALPTSESVYQGFLMVARLGLDRTELAPEHARVLHAAVSSRLRAAAGRGRTTLLRTVAGEGAALAALTGADGVLGMIRSVHEICDEWNWQTG